MTIEEQTNDILARMNWCYCGSDDAERELLDALRRVKEGRPMDGPWEFKGKVLDAFKLTEHGTNVRTSWLTEEGQVLMSFLEKHDCDIDKSLDR